MLEGNRGLALLNSARYFAKAFPLLEIIKCMWAAHQAARAEVG